MGVKAALSVAVLLYYSILLQNPTHAAVQPKPEMYYYFDYLSSVLIDRNYSVTIPDGDPPLKVTTQLYIESVRDIESSCIVDLYLRETWMDPRLITWHPNDMKFSKQYPKLVNEQTKILWRPDSYFFKIRAETVHLTQFLWANTTGEMLSSRMFTVVIPCHLDVLLYPFDTVVCKMSISSFSYITQELVYNWNSDKPIAFPPDNLDDLTMNFLSIEQVESDMQYEMGNFSSLVVHIKFGRNMSSFFVQVFAPAALIVLLSWLGFYINRNSTPARASIGVTTVLTMLTLASQTNYSRNEVIIQSTTACDIYIWLCFAFVIAAMIEFALADYFNKPRFRTESRASKQSNIAMQQFHAGSKLIADESQPFNSSETTPAKSEISREFFRRRKPREESAAERDERLLGKITHYLSTNDTRSRSSNVDIFSRVAFPIAFLLFNAGYWLIIALAFRRYKF